jgi:NitT/TauT family transport system ATP-binding protein
MASSGQLSIRNAGKIYDPEGIHVIALDQVSLEVKANEFCVVVGPSGCGKTTLLNAIAGFDQLTNGEIFMDGTVLASPGKKLLPGPDRMVVFQQGALFPWKSVIWNVTCGPVKQGRMNYSEAAEKGRELLARVGLHKIEDQFPEGLSGGQKRRVEIVRALMNDPRVLLFDEPFRALDALTKSLVQEHLLELYDFSPKTVFFITHDLEEAIFLADQVAVMTTRPGTIKKILNVDIPRPRDHRVLTSDRFLELKAELGAAIHEEAKKAFEAGERELA